MRTRKLSQTAYKLDLASPEAGILLGHMAIAMRRGGLTGALNCLSGADAEVQDDLLDFLESWDSTQDLPEGETGGVPWDWPTRVMQLGRGYELYAREFIELAGHVKMHRKIRLKFE